jgi:hypothetical protein
VLPVAAVAGVAVQAGPVPRQVDEDGSAVRGETLAEPFGFAEPDQVGEGEARLCGDPVHQGRVRPGDVQVPGAVVVGQPGPGAGLIQQVVGDARQRGRLHRLPGGEQLRPQHADGIEGGRVSRAARDHLVGVEEMFQGGGVRESVRLARPSRLGIHEVGRKHESGRRVMSKSHLDS